MKKLAILGCLLTLVPLSARAADQQYVCVVARPDRPVPLKVIVKDNEIVWYFNKSSPPFSARILDRTELGLLAFTRPPKGRDETELSKKVQSRTFVLERPEARFQPRFTWTDVRPLDEPAVFFGECESVPF